MCMVNTWALNEGDVWACEIDLIANTRYARSRLGIRCMLVYLAIKFDCLLDQHAPHSTVGACAMGICEKVYGNLSGKSAAT